MRARRVKWTFFSLLLVPIIFLACKPDPDYYNPSPSREGSILEELNRNPDYSLFKEALIRAGYETALGGGAGLYTVFAPNNQAVQEFLTKAGISSFNDLSPTELNKYIGAHLLPSTLLYPYDFETRKFNVRKDDRYATMSSKYATVVYKNASDFTINGIKINQEYKGTGNGILYTIDKFLTPQKSVDSILRTNPNYSEFNKLVNMFRRKIADPLLKPVPRRDGSGVDTIYRDISLLAADPNSDASILSFFAPTNQAMQDFLSTTPYTKVEDIPVDMAKLLVEYHMVPPADVNVYTPAKKAADLTTGTLVASSKENIIIGTDISASNIVEADITASNGLMQGINKVMVPPALKTAMGKTFYHTDLSIFRSLAAKASGSLFRRFLYLESPVKNYTILAPTNTAMIAAGLNQVAVDALAAADAEAILRAQLLRVVLASTGWTNGTTYETFRMVDGTNKTVTYVGNSQFQDYTGKKTTVTTPDITGDASILHKTDTVLSK